jgi:hypothetical protein
VTNNYTAKRVLLLIQSRLEHLSFRWGSRKKKFTKIYTNGGFGRENVPLSGTGSTLMQTHAIRVAIPYLLKELQATSIIDAPCGDFTWMKEVDLGDIAYLGVDIVPDLIRANREKHSSDRVRFLDMDIVTDILPKADVILCRDCFVHLSNGDILRAVENFKKSGSKYLLTTTFADLKENVNLVSGRGWRPINLELPPFKFPNPIAVINEGCSEEGGKYANKCLGLWQLKDV